MQILIGSYMKFSDMKFSVIRKNTLDLSGQFMSELPRNEDTKPVSLEDAFKNRPAVKLTISEEGLESWMRENSRRRKQTRRKTNVCGLIPGPVIIPTIPICFIGKGLFHLMEIVIRI